MKKKAGAKKKGGSRAGRKAASTSSAIQNDDAIVETQPSQEVEEAAKVESPAAKEAENEEEAKENAAQVESPSAKENAAKVESPTAKEAGNEEEAKEEEQAKPDSSSQQEKDPNPSQNLEAKGASSSQPQADEKKEEIEKPLRRGMRQRATKNETEKKEDNKSAPRAKPARATKPQGGSEPEYFKDKRNLEDLWKDAFPVGTEWGQLDELYEFKWDFTNLEEALEEDGKLYGKKVYVFGCAESHLVYYKDESKTVLVPAVVCIESPIPPSDEIAISSVEGKEQEIIPMKAMKLAWDPYIPLEKRDRQVDRMNFQIFILGCTQRRSALKHLKEDHVKKFNYCLPYINNPFKEDESEQSTVVQIAFPSEPPSHEPPNRYMGIRQESTVAEYRERFEALCRLEESDGMRIPNRYTRDATVRGIMLGDNERGNKLKMAASRNDLSTVKELRFWEGYFEYLMEQPANESVNYASDDWPARVWSDYRGSCDAVLACHAGPVQSVEYSTFDKGIITGSADGLLCFWENNDEDRLLEKGDHKCHSLTAGEDLEYIKKFGIGVHTGEEKFNCATDAPSQDGERIKIKGVIYMGDDLDAALKRLVHQPVGAIVAVFSSEYDATKDGVYRGPTSSSSTLECYHGLVVVSAWIEDSEVILYCKSSHGVDAHMDGYIKISASIMLERELRVHVTHAGRENPLQSLIDLRRKVGEATPETVPCWDLVPVRRLSSLRTFLTPKELISGGVSNTQRIQKFRNAVSKRNPINVVSKEQVQCLGAEISKKIDKQLGDEIYCFIDQQDQDNGVLKWKSPLRDVEFKPGDDHQKWEEIRFSGTIRDQKDHLLCAAYTATDLVSSSRVIDELDAVYQTLSVKEICFYVYENERKLRAAKKDGHHCHPMKLSLALEYVKRHGVRIQKGPETFDCKTDAPKKKGDDLITIEDIVTVGNNMKKILYRLRCQPLGATVACFEPEFSDTIDGVYSGPTSNSSKFTSFHCVEVLRACRKDGDLAFKCKSSNGAEENAKGYIYVSATTVIMGFRFSGNSLPTLGIRVKDRGDLSYMDEANPDDASLKDAIPLISDFMCPKLSSYHKRREELKRKGEQDTKRSPARERARVRQRLLELGSCSKT